MEIVSYVFFMYLQCLGSWWWITLSFVLFLIITARCLQDDDHTLSIRKALLLSLIGILSFIPLVKNYLPLNSELDFWTRWEMGGVDSLSSFIFWLGALIFFALPIVFVLAVIAELIDRYHFSSFGYDVNRYGFKQAIKQRMHYLKQD